MGAGTFKEKTVQHVSKKHEEKHVHLATGGIFFLREGGLNYIIFKFVSTWLTLLFKTTGNKVFKYIKLIAIPHKAPSLSIKYQVASFG